jgi:hypothetical protein
MINVNSVLCALLLTLGAVGASSANDGAVLFVDHGVLTSVSEHGVLKMDTATGDMYVSTSNGNYDRSLFFPGSRKQTPAFESNALVFLSAKDAGFQKRAGDCQFKQEAVDLTTRNVLIACAGGDSTNCRNARSAAMSAWDDFWLCANNLPEPP